MIDNAVAERTWAPASRGMYARLPLVWLSLAVFVADQASKFWAVLHLTDVMAELLPPHALADALRQFWQVVHPRPLPSIAVIDSCFHFRYVENPGAAWGFLSATPSAWRTPFFLLLSVGAMAAIATFLWRTPKAHARLRYGLALVFGGAFGNFVDRIRLGYVIDFIDWHLGQGYTWPTFNVADAAISVGVGLLLLDSFYESRRA